ncbi:hypothetical protein Tco_0596108 [Tanacetum coccineum]
MIANLEKTEGNVEFHEVIDFLQRSYISHALTVSPVVSTTFVEQFWTSAKSKTINSVRHITAKVAGKLVSITEASIRTDLLFDDADGIDTLPNQAIFDAIQLMGYEGDLTVLTFNKALFSPQWRFLFHTINHCLSSKSSTWDQIPTNIATAVICLTTNQKYNFSKLIFDGMLRHLEAKKKFVMYPRFISVFLARQLVNITVPLDHFPVNSLTSKVFSFMVKKGKHFSGKITPLFDNMLVQPTQKEGTSSERLSEAQPTPSPEPTSEAPNESLPDSSSAQSSEVPFEQQPDLSPSPSPRPSPNPSPTPIIPDSIPEPTGENLGDHSFNDTSLSGNEDAMTLQNVYDLCISLCKQVSDQAKEIKLLKAKITKLKKKANPVIKHFKGYQKRISKNIRHQRNISQRKRSANKVFDASEEIFKVSRKSKKNGKSEEEKNKMLKKKSLMKSLIKILYDVKARIEADRILVRSFRAKKEMRLTIEGRAKFLHDTIMKGLSKQLNKKRGGLSKSEVIKEDTKEEVKDEDKDEESTRKRKLGVHTLMTNEGVVIHMLTEKKYPLKKEILVQMLNLRLESEEESTMALELIRFIKKSHQDQEGCGLKHMTLAHLSSALVPTPKSNQPLLHVHILKLAYLARGGISFVVLDADTLLKNRLSLSSFPDFLHCKGTVKYRCLQERIDWLRQELEVGKECKSGMAAHLISVLKGSRRTKAQRAYGALRRGADQGAGFMNMSRIKLK